MLQRFAKSLKSTKSLFIAVIVGTFGLSVGHVKAVELNQEICAQKPDLEICSASGGNNLFIGDGGVLSSAIQVIVLAVGVASVIMIIVGGIRFIVGAGDSSQMVSARNTIIYALVGLAVAITAQSILSFVIGRL